jgi:hypothetical protein
LQNIFLAELIIAVFEIVLLQLLLAKLNKELFMEVTSKTKPVPSTPSEPDLESIPRSMTINGASIVEIRPDMPAQNLVVCNALKPLEAPKVDFQGNDSEMMRLGSGIPSVGKEWNGFQVGRLQPAADNGPEALMEDRQSSAS